MTPDSESPGFRLWTRELLRVTCVVAILALSTGCETAGDIASAVNPANLFADDEETTTEAAEPPPGADADYPNIGSVPERPATPYLLRNAESVRQSLVADKENARYTDEVLRAEGPSPGRGAPQAATLPQGVSIPQAGTTSDTSETLQRPQTPPAAITPPPVVEPRPSPEPVPVPTPQPSAQQQPSTQQPRAAELPQPSATTPQPASPQPRAATLPEQPQAVEAPQPRAVELPQQPRVAELPSQPEPSARPASPPPAAADVIGLTAPRGAAATASATESASRASAGAEQPAVGDVVHVATIYFPEGGARLTSRDQQVIDQALALFRDGGKSIRVVGHASSPAGTADEGRQNLVNYKASLDRATAVAQAFVDRGLTMDRIELSAVGAREPRFSEETSAGISGNQRTEIFIRY